MISILQVRFTEVKYLAQGHTAGKEHGQDLNPAVPLQSRRLCSIPGFTRESLPVSLLL